MTDREVHLPVSAQPDIDDLIRMTTRAEELGYDRVWIPETWGRNAVAVLTRMADRTDRVGIGASVLNVYSRSPGLLGQTAATLQEASDGRFRMGIGPSGPALIEGWHGVDFTKPLRRTRETLEVVRAILDGKPVDYDGSVFSLSGFKLRCDPPSSTPAIDVAAMGPTAVEMTGRYADGWHATVFTPNGLSERLTDLRRGAALADRELDEIRTMLSMPCCALTDQDHARELAARHVAFYIGAMGTFYRDSLARQGHESLANDVAAAWASGDRQRASRLVESELLDRIAAVGTPTQAHRTVERFEAIDELDAIAVSFPRGAATADVFETLEAFAP